jgi:carboxypeptidase Taq
MKQIGFNFDQGRLDVSLHPFCGGTSQDVRITTRYKEDDFTQSLMGVLHETGHAMYELGLPKDYSTQPVGLALGMTIHESQSLLMEMQVCRSRPFINYLSTILPQYLGKSDAYKPDNLYNLYNNVEPGLIRVDADEVTYPLHVIVRYEIEKDLVEGDMEVDDIPQAWNEAYKKYLGIDVPNDKDGCMQDIHWSDGSFGYFPTYTLGAMTAAQFYKKAVDDNPEIPSEIERGDFSRLVTWLRENIHSQGSLHSPTELTEKVTGESLSSEIFKSYLQDKYLN